MSWSGQTGEKSGHRKEEGYVGKGMGQLTGGRRASGGTHQWRCAEGGTVRTSELVRRGGKVRKPKERERLSGTH